MENEPIFKYYNPLKVTQKYLQENVEGSVFQRIIKIIKINLKFCQFLPLKFKYVNNVVNLIILKFYAVNHLHIISYITAYFATKRSHYANLDKSIRG